nr:probable indole-3-pyruvate monooxygenase YUCCA10 isoform X2 [Quercus suber]POE62183.1 putative indole-3-pyruvate monooxygenase yucca10 [Quercus suber]
MQEQVAIIVGSGPSGLATAACLSQQSIPYIILEREECIASIWKIYSYDRLHLHLAKQFCELPLMSFPASYPTFVPKTMFIQYLDDYVSHFNISPMFQRTVESAEYNEVSKRWIVKARNASSGEVEIYSAKFLVVATGETTNPYTPEVEGLNTFPGEVLHSTKYKSGKEFKNKNVLVVGSGNSGVEIALDLANHGAKTSIIFRSPAHFLSREMVYLGLTMLKYFPVSLVDFLMVMLSKLVYGDLTKYGIGRPTEGPFYMKVKYGKYPLFDVGTYKKIKSGEIQVLPAEIIKVQGNGILFKNDRLHPFNTIIFCTGFKRSTNLWLKGDEYLLNEDGLAKPTYPNHWKGKNGLYCVGLSRRGLYGASADAQNIANDIKSIT